MLLVRKSSSIKEDSPAPQEDAKIEAEDEQSGNENLKQLLKDAAGLELLLSTDFESLQAKLMQTIARIITNDQQTMEEKQIVENAMSLWIGILTYKKELFKSFSAYEGDANSSIKNAEDLVMTGLLYCKEEKIREDFKASLLFVSRKLNSGEANVLNFLIKVLSANFNKISDYPCVQFFDLYNELIDIYYMNKAMSADAKDDDVFDPELLLSFIIDKIRTNKSAIKAAEDTDDTAVDEIFAKQLAE
jgi:hypothetical protein